MRATAFRLMLLSLLRDPAALAMSFVLPAVVFVIFALIFAGASGGDLAVRVAVADEQADGISTRLVDTLLGDRRMQRIPLTGAGSDGVRAAVRSGEADVGFVIRRTTRPLDDLAAPGPAPIAIIANPSREISVSILMGAVQRAYFTAVPQSAVRSVAGLIDQRMAPLTPEQRLRIEKGLEAMRSGNTGEQAQAIDLARLSERSDVVIAGKAPQAVTYYAGAVAMLFLLFSALTGAMSHIDERESGLIDRLAIGPGGTGVLIDGKLAFLVVQGFLQVLVIYLVAWLTFGVELVEHLLPWAATTLASALSAGGLALAFAALCRTRQQAQTLGQMLILIVSAVGGSMVPRYLMPDYVQGLGWATPNTWALEAYTAIFARGERLTGVAVPCLVLAGVGVAGYVLARLAAARRT